MLLLHKLCGQSIVDKDTPNEGYHLNSIKDAAAMSQWRTLSFQLAP